MTEHTKTISNSFNLLGLGPPTVWGAFDWSDLDWGFGQMFTDTDKVISDSLSPTTALPYKEIEAGFNWSIGVYDTTIHKDATIFFTSTFSPLDFETSSEVLSDGIWDHVFVGPSTNAENRSTATFSPVADDLETWVSNTTATTVWS